MLNTVIFDMDGLLIDSEPLWGEAMAEVFATLNLHLPPDAHLKTTGLRTREVVDYWHRKTKWTAKSPIQVEQEILDLVRHKIMQSGKAMQGVEYILQFFREKQFPIGLASSSPMDLIQEVLDHLHIREYFQAVSSAQDLEFGKPHPQVYLNCARELKAKPMECIAFEDSITGILAAKAARMRTVAVPDMARWEDPRLAIADLHLHSLLEFSSRELSQLNAKE
ncbi:MAG: hexitol phosphatase HxpB [Chitinophagaceae bacterium]